MYLVPVSFDGVNLNDSNYGSMIPDDAPASWNVTVVENARSNAFGRFASIGMSGVTLPLTIFIRNGSLLALKKLFDPSTPYLVTPKTLVVVDAGGTQWQCQAVAQNLVETTQKRARALLRVSEPVWTRVTVTSVAAWNAPGAGPTITIPANRTWSNPTIKIKPTGANPGGFAHDEPISVLNVVEEDAATLPLKIISGWNTTALVSGGQLQSGGQDVRITDRGREIDAWVSAPNTDHTGVWINEPLRTKLELKLGAAIASSGAVSEVTFAKGSESTLKKLPTNGVFKIDDEFFSFTGAINAGARKIGGTVRAARNTSMAAHSVGATVTIIVDHDYHLLWGNSTIAARVNDESRKPAFDLELSSNTEWVFTEFGDAAAGGTMGAAWKPSTKSQGGASGHYTDDGNVVEGVSPAKVLGHEALAYLNNKNKLVGDTVEIQWGVFHPFGFGAVSGSGRKYRVGNAFPAFRVERSKDGSTWKTVWSEGSPVNASTWTSFTMTEQSLGASSSYVPRWLRSLLKGAVSGVTDGMARVEMQAITAKPISTRVPTIIRHSDTANAAGIDCTITNATTGDELRLAYPAAQGKTLTVDTGNQVITYEGIPADGALVEIPARGDWLPLLSGANVLSYAGAGSGTVEILIEYRERMMW